MRALLLILCLTSASTHCFGVSVPKNASLPWFTGPLLTPTARVLQAGHVNLEPYAFWTITNGHYNSDWQAHARRKLYHLNTLLTFKIGLGHHVDFSGVIQSSKKWTQKNAYAGFGDPIFGFDLQLIEGNTDKGIPFLKLSILEIFPVGKFEHLHPMNEGTEHLGKGSFATNIGLTCSGQFHFSGDHYLNCRAQASTTLFPPVHVSGISVYGGDPSTCGRVYPGTTFNFLAAAEYSLTANWALAVDFQAHFAARNRFKGHTKTPVRDRSSAQMSLAPALEYNWNEMYGLIVGSWFTLAGRNAPRFVSYVAGFNCNF